MKRTTFKYYMLKNILTISSLVILMICNMQAAAQKSVVTAALSKYGVDPVFLDPANLRTPADHAFDLKESTTTAGKTKVIRARFEPLGAGREQWKVTSVDGRSPTRYETNTFRNTREKPPVDKPDETTYRIDSETPEQLVVSYKLDAASIPKDAAVLKDCRAVLTVDLRTKQLAQLKLVNEKPVRIGPLTASKFEVVTMYAYDKQLGRYVPSKDNLDMFAAFLGKSVTTQIETLYSNFTDPR